MKLGVIISMSVLLVIIGVQRIILRSKIGYAAREVPSRCALNGKRLEKVFKISIYPIDIYKDLVYNF